MDRAERRRRTWLVCLRQHRLRERILYRPEPFEWTPLVSSNAARYSENHKKPHRYAKHHSMHCGCSKRQHGRPKVGVGMCGVMAREHVILARGEVRQLRNLILRAHLDPLSDEVAVVLTPESRLSK